MKKISELHLSRRHALKAFGLGLSGLAAPWRVMAHSMVMDREGALNVLRIPEQLHGREESGVLNFDLRLQEGLTEFMEGDLTRTIGVNKSYLGPTLRYRRGDSINIRVENALPDSSVLHWHGLHLPPAADGGPHSVISPGESGESRFDCIQPAGTFWYHSHAMHRTGPEVYRGLAGLMLIDDEVSDTLDLPSQYGVDDLPLILQDRRFDRNNQLVYLTDYQHIMMGMMGDTMLVNGTINPVFNARHQRLRLRLLNGSNARQFTLAFSDARPFYFVASDGGFLEQPVRMEQLVLTPGERGEIVVELNPGERLELVNVPNPVDFPEFPGELSRLMRLMNVEAFRVLRIEAAAELEAAPPLPTQLARVPRAVESTATHTRHFRLGMGNGPRSGNNRGPATGYRNGYGGGFGGGHFSINGRTMNMHFINERVTLGSTEIWEVYNFSPMMHPFHVHGCQFQVLDRDGELPPAHEMGYKDTVRIEGYETVRLIMSFTEYADEHIPYMYHCHTLEHEDRGMMGQFLVLPA